MPCRILVAPGIGDIHWVALKLRSFCEKLNLGIPELWVWNFDGRPRSLEFVKRLPFATAGDYLNQELSGESRRAFRFCYLEGASQIVPGLLGFDYFICVNGRLRTAADFERDVMPGYDTDWNYGLKQTAEEERLAEGFEKRGPCALFYFSGSGMFDRWLKAWPAIRVARFLEDVHLAQPGLRMILTGSIWDRPFAEAIERSLSFAVDNVAGLTTFDEFMAMLRHATAFAGWCGGNTIVSTHLGVPTYILWSEFFQEPFYSNWVAPHRLGKTYLWDRVESIGPEAAARKFVTAIKGGERP